MTFGAMGEWAGRAIAQGRIGRPVAVRLHAFVSPDHGQLVPSTAEALAMVAKWFEADLVLLEARGAVESGHIVALAQFEAGQTALVSGTCLFEGPSRLDFILLGSQGSVRHEGLADAASEPLVFRGNELADEALVGRLRNLLAM